jgi:hypothetical protein
MAILRFAIRNVAFCRSTSATVIIIAASLGAETRAFADNWLIARETMSGVCTVQLETSRPYLGTPLAGRYPTRKDACNQAVTLRTVDPAETQKCFDYSPATVTGCLIDGVNLPK